MQKKTKWKPEKSSRNKRKNKQNNQILLLFICTHITSIHLHTSCFYSSTPLASIHLHTLCFYSFEHALLRNALTFIKSSDVNPVGKTRCDGYVGEYVNLKFKSETAHLKCWNAPVNYKNFKFRFLISGFLFQFPILNFKFPITVISN